MTPMQVDAVLQRYGPPATIEIPPWIADARRAIGGAVGRLLELDDDGPRPTMVVARRSRGRRRGALRVLPLHRDARGSSRSPRLARPATAGPMPAAAGAFGLGTMARWDLHGLLAPLADADLDLDPGGGEWTIRQTLAHAVNVQRAYPSFSAWWLTPRADPRPAAERAGRGRRRLPGGAGGGSGIAGGDPGPARRSDGRRRDADGITGRRTAGDAGALVGLRRRRRLSPGPPVVAPPGAHRPGREDARDARPDARARRIGSPGSCCVPTDASRPRSTRSRRPRRSWVATPCSARSTGSPTWRATSGSPARSRPAPAT